MYSSLWYVERRLCSWSKFDVCISNESAIFNSTFISFGLPLCLFKRDHVRVPFWIVLSSFRCRVTCSWFCILFWEKYVSLGWGSRSFNKGGTWVGWLAIDVRLPVRMSTDLFEKLFLQMVLQMMISIDLMMIDWILLHLFIKNCVLDRLGNSFGRYVYWLYDFEGGYVNTKIY